MGNTRNDVVSRSTKAYARTLGANLRSKPLSALAGRPYAQIQVWRNHIVKSRVADSENMGPVYAEASNKLPYRSTKPKSAKQISKVLKKRPQDYNRSAEYIAGLS